MCPRNDTVLEINNEILKRLPGNTELLVGFDTLDAEGQEDALSIYIENNCIEQVHLRTPSGFPPYELRLKIGSSVMLIKNLDLSNGLCNGTRLQGFLKYNIF